VLSNATPLQNGTASVTVTVGEDDLDQLAVVTASVGHTVCLVSKRLSPPGGGSASAVTGYNFVVSAPEHASAPVTLALASGSNPGVTVEIAGIATALPATVTTNASGLIYGYISLPSGGSFTAAQLKLLTKDAQRQFIPGSFCLLSPITAASGSGGGGGPDPASTLSAKARSVAVISSELHTGAHYANLPGGQLPAEEAAELTREAIEDARQLFDPPAANNPPPPQNEMPAVDDLAPLALGGDLAQQAEKAITLVDLAAAINGACDNAAALARELDGEDDNDIGAQVGKVHTAYSNWSWLRAALPSGLDWHPVVYQKVDEHYTRLLSAAGPALRAAVKAAKAFDDWEKLEQISADLGVLPYIQDAHVLIATLDEEAFINLIHALARYSATLAKDPGATVLATIQNANPWIAAKINAWAQQNGPDAQVIAAAAGLYSQMLQNSAMLAAAAGGPEKAFKRMAGEFLGMVMGAAMGSEEARDELKEMVPFYSWLLLGPKVKTKWEAQDYYGAGQEAWNLTLQVVGDVTMFLPVIKGAAAGIRVVGQELKIVFEQGLKKRGTGGFGRGIRNSINDVPNGPGKAIQDYLPGGCFPPGTLVLMADGSTKPIEAIVEGDKILADNPNDLAAPSAKTVLQLHPHNAESLMHIEVDQDGDGRGDGLIRATSAHAFWTQQRGWVSAKELNSGDALQDDSGRTPRVLSTLSVPTITPTFNLSVEDAHTYFVLAGDIPLLVHNTNPGTRLYIVYEAIDAAGKKYVGRASMPLRVGGDGELIPLTPRDVLKYRFKGGHHRGLDMENAKIRWDGLGGGRTSEAYKTCRGMEEHYYLEVPLAQRTDQIAPTSERNPRKDEYRAAKTRSRNKTCAS